MTAIGSVGLLLEPGVRSPISPSWILFLCFSVLVVYVCQRLVEDAALALGAIERRSAFSRAAVCIGALVWALDAMGLFLYPGIFPDHARLIPALLALLIMVASARMAVSFLVHTRKPVTTFLAGAGLGVGLLAGHAVLMSALGPLTGAINWAAALVALVITTVLAGGMALRHRSVRLRAACGQFCRLSWPENVLAGLVVLPLHMSLARVLSLHSVPPAPSGTGTLPVLLTLVAFSVVIGGEKLFSIASDSKQRSIMNRAFAMMRSVHGRSDLSDGRRIALVAELAEQVLGDGALTLHYQPILHVDGSRRVRFEALLRVRDPHLGPVDPELFFLACERIGISARADRRVILQTLEDSSPWKDAGGHCLGISVNISPATLLENDFVPWLKTQLKSKACPPGWLELELTEHALIAASDPIREALERLRKNGVRVAMDDFGAGFSSLGTLVELPIQVLKLDRSLIRNIHRDPARQALLRHLCAMSRDLGLFITVEGLETAEDLALVKAAGAHSGQGYRLGYPMPPEDVAHWCEADGLTSEAFFLASPLHHRAELAGARG